MKKDIFSATKKSIIAISTSVVFGCLIIFALVTNALYSSKVLDNVDHQILEQKKFLTEYTNISDYEKVFDSANFMEHEKKIQSQEDIPPSDNIQLQSATNTKGDMTNKSDNQKDVQVKGFDGRLSGKFMKIPPIIHLRTNLVL